MGITINQKYLALACIVAVVAIACVSFVLLYNPPAHITVSNTRILHDTQYAVNGNITALDPLFEGEVTWVIFYFDLSTTKTEQFNLADFTLTINGQAPNIIYNNGTLCNIYKDQTNECSVSFYVAGAYAGGFELIYNGPADVEINHVLPVYGG